MTNSKERSPPDFSDQLGGNYGPYHSWDPVNTTMIRHWCEAIGDKNPLYDIEQTDGYAAPPAMLQSWTMTGYCGHFPDGSTADSQMPVLEVMEAAGYRAIVAVDCEQEYIRYLVEGDKVHHYSTIESISEEKSTALGKGFFVTQFLTYFDQAEDLVATMRFRVFKYRPHTERDCSQGGET